MKRFKCEDDERTRIVDSRVVTEYIHEPASRSSPLWQAEEEEAPVRQYTARPDGSVPPLY
eukprot:COSAG02_NODE_10957_length_1824_cov_16.928696_2_plen_60_part_00